MGHKTPIGIFDSGYGGLTVMRSIMAKMPQYDYIYLGDNARSPYGTRSFDTVYHYTLESVQYLFHQGCKLVILACNTASAKALRNIQQLDLPRIDPQRRVLGVIRPTVEVVGNYSSSKQIGIMATTGTVLSESYVMEMQKLWPAIEVFQEACPMWVPLVENGEYDKAGADYFIQRHLQSMMDKAPAIDTLVLGCTHYPLLLPKIQQFVPGTVKILAQGDLVANSLQDYLFRHPELEKQCSQHGHREFLTTDDPALFNKMSSIFMGQPVTSRQVDLGIHSLPQSVH
jgi:glutamate racemase